MQKTFQEISKSWCETKRPIVKHSTMCAYLLTLQTHLLPYFGTKTAITEDDVQKFVIHKLSCGLARKTVRDMVAVLKSVAKYGRKHKIFPFEDWEIEYPTDTEITTSDRKTDSTEYRCTAVSLHRHENRRSMCTAMAGCGLPPTDYYSKAYRWPGLQLRIEIHGENTVVAQNKKFMPRDTHLQTIVPMSENSQESLCFSVCSRHIRTFQRATLLS